MHHHLRRCPATARSYLSERPHLGRREVGRSGTTAALKEKAGASQGSPSALVGQSKGLVSPLVSTFIFAKKAANPRV